MLEKLRTEASELQNTVDFDSLLYAYRTLNAAITAWHLTDWTFTALQDVHKERLLGTFGVVVKKKSDLAKYVLKNRAVYLCRQLATSAKHVEVVQHADESVSLDHDMKVVRRPDKGADIYVRLIIRDGANEKHPKDVVWLAYIFWQDLLGAIGMLEHEGDI